MILEKIKNLPKKYIYAGLGIVLAALVSYLVYFKKGGQYNNAFPAANEVLPSSTVATSSAVVIPKKAPAKSAAPLSVTQKYLDAIKIYKNVGYYFQFVDCHGAPGTLTLKAGKKFMLDNRDGAARKIAIQGGQTFQIKAYDFAIATAPSAIGTHYITCDGGGAASILVQK